MTCMDIWLFICIDIVVFSLVEYTVLLYILLADEDMVAGGKKTRKVALCRKIDYFARRIFLGLEILIVGGYFYWVFAQSHAL